MTREYNTCDAGVTRDGEYVPCDKPAVGLYRDQDPEWAGYPAYPVCVFHLRKDGAVPLTEVAEILAAWRWDVNA